jgi:hypothetical protein
MAARTKRKAPKQPIVVSSISFTPDTRDTLQRFGRDLSDVIGLPISGSASVRALLAWAAQQPAGWAARTLAPFVEAELQRGRLWGSRPKKGGKR